MSTDLRPVEERLIRTFAVMAEQVADEAPEFAPTAIVSVLKPRPRRPATLVAAVAVGAAAAIAAGVVVTSRHDEQPRLVQTDPARRPVVAPTTPAVDATTVAVPNVVGKTRDEALEILGAAGLGTTFTASEQAAPGPSAAGRGIVLAQDPAGGRVARGAVVTLTLDPTG